ncbi:YihY/virulence factor BrkB family protein [Halosimplex salinum]|uniref:YihY/virulence factor BrkB family protein n=1 Tax=Halosimplex salinum TaxID=1710538 RepID=UPI000F47849F|nr:YihY/virulence factor BrkB family protein [Halosimplex salinum]
MSLAARRPVGRAVTFTRSLVSVYRDRDVGFMAGSVAFSAFVSLIPLVVLLVIAASVVGGEGFRQSVVDTTSGYLTPASQGVVEESIEQARGSVELSVIGIVALLWAVMKVFRSLDTAFSDLYAVETDEGFVDHFRDGVIVLGAMGIAVLTMTAVGAIVAVAPTFSPGGEAALPLIRVAGFVVLIVGLIVAFLPMYYVFPDVEMTIRRALPGAVVAAVGWTILQALFQVYVSMTAGGELYGVIGGAVLLVIWLYFGAVVVLVGGATNVVLTGSHSSADLSATK